MVTIDRRTLLNTGILFSTVGVSNIASAETSPHADKPFTFCVLGDTCYKVEKDYTTYMALIDEINRHEPAFTIHVGDTKGAGPCDEALHRRVHRDFERFTGPLVYTPGDNEWVDAYLEVNENGDPLEALSLIRSIFFSEPFSLGQQKMSLVRQADITEHSMMVENAIWNKHGILFGTLHVPGTNNGYWIDGERESPEFEGRHVANLEWIKTIFATAKARNTPAVVIAFHADWYRKIDYEPNAFLAVDAMLREESASYGKPVLLLHGDYHIFKIDRPYHRKGEGGLWGKGYNVLRLQPHGAPELKAVLVTVEPSSLDPFSFRTISVPQVHRLDEI